MAVIDFRRSAERYDLIEGGTRNVSLANINEIAIALDVRLSKLFFRVSGKWKR